MLRTLIMKRSGVVLLLVGVVTGVAGAQVFQALQLSRKVETGLFTVGDRERATVNVTVTGAASNEPSQVSVRFFDPAGTAVASQVVTLLPGVSATISPRGLPSGRYRAVVDLYDPPSVVPRRVPTTIEVFDADTGDPRCEFYPGEGVGLGRQ
jgi:hypothetical protein